MTLQMFLYGFRAQVCCGIIFKGMNGEVLVDPTLLRPCQTCKKSDSNHTPGARKGNRGITQRKQPALERRTSLDDSDSNPSTPSFRGMADFYEPNTPDPETPPDSPPDSLKDECESDIITQLTPTKNNYVSNRAITMEC